MIKPQENSIQAAGSDESIVSHSSIRSGVYRCGIALGYCTLLALVSLLPSGGSPAGGWDTWVSPSTQNFLHLPAYTVLVLLILTSIGTTAGPLWRSAIPACLACVCYGALLEWLQAFIPGRFASISDILWNTIGVMTGGIAWTAMGTDAKSE